jgi:hypothetical protein
MPTLFVASCLLVSIRQHTSAYVSIRQHTSADVSRRQQTSADILSALCRLWSCLLVWSPIYLFFSLLWPVSCYSCGRRGQPDKDRRRQLGVAGSAAALAGRADGASRLTPAGMYAGGCWRMLADADVGGGGLTAAGCAADGC